MKVQSGFGLQDSTAPVMTKICSFHDQMMVVVVFILSVVSYILITALLCKSSSRSLVSSESLETFWTVLPCSILVSLAAPSLFTLYMSDELTDPFLSLKVIGHQWYWSYEYGDSNVSFDSYMIPTNILEHGHRLLECDQRAFLPLCKEVQLIISSSDVIHSWTLPSAGVKMDAIPGRLNQAIVFCTRLGLLYGQCSEICGSLHPFMPVCVEVVTLENFLKIFNCLPSLG